MPQTSAEVRAALLDALRLDLIGPRPEHEPHQRYAGERLPVAPSKWYLTGFLVPFESPLEQRVDDASDDTLDTVTREGAGDDEQPPEAASARKAWFPSSMGLSVLVPAETAQLRVKVSWADYAPKAASEGEGERAGRGAWQRVPREADRVLTLHRGDRPQDVSLSDAHPELRLVMSVREVGAHEHLHAGTRSVSVFLVNKRPPAPDSQRDAAYVFQPELSLTGLQPFVGRPDTHGLDSKDWDDKVADLQYRDAVEYAVGHNVSALADVKRGRCERVRTAWMPTAEVHKVVAAKLEGVELGMEALAEAPDAQTVRARVGPMLEAYADWITRQGDALPSDPRRRVVAKELLESADRARARILAGLDALDDPLALKAFQLTNKVIARAIRQRACHDKPDCEPEDLAPPAWRPFQLAFLVMNLCGVLDPSHPDRRVVDLLFFPTGGGKTEAYLGLAAFTMLLRRLRDPSVQSAGLSVLMRYTLRLLTLDQLGRAATLVCAMELERQQDVKALGLWPFEIGLWVGQSATPNRMGRKGDKDAHSARRRTIAYLNDPERRPSPIPLESCPWCGWRFTPKCFQLLPDHDAPTELRVSCQQRKCAFHIRRQHRGLPILAVDEPIYRRLPAFIIATVDKFANLPWVGEAGGLFGRVQRFDEQGFYGPAAPGRGRALDGPLRPPDLVIQDELHLISGPLGTMVGLYETVIDALATDLGDAEAPRPKVVASTATVRRAERQIQGLFGRSDVEIFPPPGPDRRDSFFAVTVPPAQRSARLYVGVAAQGRNMKVVLLRTCLALLGAAQKLWLANGGAKNERNPADPYMTLLGYFGALRELGGSRRILEDEVAARLTDYAQRRRRVGEAEGLFANRSLTEPRELTSRVGTDKVAETKQRLAQGFHTGEGVDVALATNMISVGLDITRLGLMVVLNQPKSAAEYIQATSRVGRDDERPGLVVTLCNIYRPRDRSHFERFAAWHESFYRAVEATSVTPFSSRAVERGLAGVTVALARHGLAAMTPPRGAERVNAERAQLGFVSELISRRAETHDRQLDATSAEALRQKVKGQVEELLDAWSSVAERKGELQYAREVGKATHLLFDPMDLALASQPNDARRFKAHRSLRDVEPTVNLWLKNPDGFDAVEDAP